MIGPIRKKVLFKCQFYHCNKNLQISKPNKEIPIDSQRGKNIFSVFELFCYILSISNTEKIVDKRTSGLTDTGGRTWSGPKIRTLIDRPGTMKT